MFSETIIALLLFIGSATGSATSTEFSTTSVEKNKSHYEQLDRGDTKSVEGWGDDD